MSDIVAQALDAIVMDTGDLNFVIPLEPGVPNLEPAQDADLEAVGTPDSAEMRPTPTPPVDTPTKTASEQWTPRTSERR